jgi:flagellar basal-body rod protein FlgC
MDFDSTMKISGSGLRASRAWLSVLSSNLANANTTRTASGKPYERRTLIYESVPVGEKFEDVMGGVLSEGLQKVRVNSIVSDGRAFKQVYNPAHPDANEQGVVEMPNVNPVEEMANIVTASRSYEANLAAMHTAKQLALKALEIGR